MTVSQNKQSSDEKKVPYHFGEKLRTVREKKGYTLKVVAQKAGVSESLVSQIERNKVSPAIDTLLNLADVLDINLEFLFDEYHKERPVEIIRNGERRTISEGEVNYEEIAAPSRHDGDQKIEEYLVSIPVKGHTHRGSYGHLGREIGYILEGHCQLQYDNETYELSAGDSVSFAAGAPHTLINTGLIPVKALWVVTPPQRFSH